jgi:hypothetical protein
LNSKKIPKSNIFTKTYTQGQFFRFVTLVSAVSLPKQKKNFSLHCSSVFIFLELQKLSSLGLKPRADFQGCGLCSCNLLAGTNSFGFGAVLLLYLVSKLQNNLHWGLNPGEFVRIVMFIPVNFYLKQTDLLLAPFICLA